MAAYTQSSGGYIAYRVDGDGPRDLLIVSGSPISCDVQGEEPHTARMLRRLMRFGRLINFDPRGAGLSDEAVAELDTSDWVEDAIAVLDAVGAEQVVVLGMVGGGATAIQLAAVAPERVAALVLVNSQARSIYADDYRFGLPQNVVDSWATKSADPQAEWTAGGEDQITLMSPSLADDRAYREWTERAIRHGTGRRGLLNTRRMMATADVRGYLPRVLAPTLVIARRENRFVAAAHGEYLAEHIPGAKLVLLPGADHMPWSGDMDELVDEIEEFVTGQRGGSADRILATILFTDIVDSTQRAAGMNDAAWRTALDAHDALVRTEITRYGGHEVNTTGDGFVATFPLPSQALLAARAITQVATTAGVDVRVGLHTGECERRGDDIAGLAVHIAARVAATGRGGEIMVSRTVRDLVAGSGRQFADRGQQQLKGLDEAWHLYVLES